MKAPLVAQQLRQEIGTSRDRLAVIIVIGTHHAQCPTLLYRLSEWFQQQGLHLFRGNMWVGPRAFITTADRQTIYGKVLWCRHNAVLLQSQHHLLP